MRSCQTYFLSRLLNIRGFGVMVIYAGSCISGTTIRVPIPTEEPIRSKRGRKPNYCGDDAAVIHRNGQLHIVKRGMNERDGGGVIAVLVAEIKWRKLQSIIGGNCRADRNDYRAMLEASIHWLTRNGVVLRRVIIGLQQPPNPFCNNLQTGSAKNSNCADPHSRRPPASDPPAPRRGTVPGTGPSSQQKASSWFCPLYFVSSAPSALQAASASSSGASLAITLSAARVIPFSLKKDCLTTFLVRQPHIYFPPRLYGLTLTVFPFCCLVYPDTSCSVGEDRSSG